MCLRHVTIHDHSCDFTLLDIIIFCLLFLHHPSQHHLSPITGVLSGHASLPTQCWNGPRGSVVFQWARICVASLGKWCLIMSESQSGFLTPSLLFLDRMCQETVLSPATRRLVTLSAKLNMKSDLTLFAFLTHRLGAQCIRARYFKEIHIANFLRAKRKVISEVMSRIPLTLNSPSPLLRQSFYNPLLFS